MTRTLPLPFFPEGQMTWLTFDFMPLIEGLNADERTQIPMDNFACLSNSTLALVVLQLRCCLNMTFLTFGPNYKYVDGVTVDTTFSLCIGLFQIIMNLRSGHRGQFWLLAQGQHFGTISFAIWHCLKFDLWPRNRRSNEEVTMETFACLPKDYMLTPLVWQFDVVWNLTFMMWHIWPFDPLNDLQSWWKKIHMYNGKMHCSKSSKKFLLSLVMEIKNYKAKTGNDPCDPIWPLINLRSTTAI